MQVVTEQRSAEDRRPTGRRRAERALIDAMNGVLAAVGLTAASRRAEVDGVALHYLELGDGPPVVLLHGAGGGAANWFGVMGRLAQRFRVLAPDLPGFGLSAAIEPRAELGRHVAEFVDTWVSGFGVHRFDLVGTSFGGLVALRLAQRRPDAVGRLVLIDSAGLGREMPAAVRLAGLRVLGPLLLRPSRWGTRWLLRRLMTSGQPLDPSFEPVLLEYLYRTARAGDPALLARAFRLFAGPRGQREVLEDGELAALHAPTLVVWGRRDAFFPPSHAERAAARIPRAMLHWIEHAGHSPNWEAPGAVADAIVDFLSAPVEAA